MLTSATFRSAAEPDTFLTALSFHCDEDYPPMRAAHAKLAEERARLHQRFLPDSTCWNTLVRGYARTLRWREASKTLQ